MDWNRIVPISVALIYAVAGVFVFISEPSTRSAVVLSAGVVLIGLALTMIWSEAGSGGWGGAESHGRWRYTPPGCVKLAGWALLFLPILLPLIVLLIRWMN